MAMEHGGIRLNNASLSGPAIDLQNGPFTVNGDRYRTMLNEFLFTKNEGGYWQHWVSTGRRYVPHS